MEFLIYGLTFCILIAMPFVVTTMVYKKYKVMRRTGVVVCMVAILAIISCGYELVLCNFVFNTLKHDHEITITSTIHNIWVVSKPSLWITGISLFLYFVAYSKKFDEWLDKACDPES